MSRKRHNTPISGDQIVPLRIPEDMRIKVRALSPKLRTTDAATMRMAIDRGLAELEKMFAAPESKAA